MHDYIHVYAPAGPVAWKKTRNGLRDEGAFSNPDNDPRGPWRSVPMSAQDGHATAAQYYTAVTPTGARHDPPKGRCWTYSQPRFEELVADGQVYWPRAGAGKPRLKRFQFEAAGLAPFTIWTADQVGDNASAKKALLHAFPDVAAFDTEAGGASGTSCRDRHEPGRSGARLLPGLRHDSCGGEPTRPTVDRNRT